MRKTEGLAFNDQLKRKNQRGKWGKTLLLVRSLSPHQRLCRLSPLRFRAGAGLSSWNASSTKESAIRAASAREIASKCAKEKKSVCVASHRFRSSSVERRPTSPTRGLCLFSFFLSLLITYPQSSWRTRRPRPSWRISRL